MRKNIYPNLLLALLIGYATISCEKPVIDINDTPGTVTPKGDMVNVKFSGFDIEHSTFGNDNDEYESKSSRASTQICSLCSRISLAVFDTTTGEKTKSVNQDNSDKNFGSISISLPKGKYAIVIIAHNGEGNPTISSPSKITFKNNKVTDTFYYYKETEINDNTNYNITLKRAVAMFRLIVKDNTPIKVHTMKFYYTGGSSTFDATSGYGCVNSKQTELRTVPDAAHNGESSYDIYTFPHEDGRTLKIDVSALESPTSTSILYTRTFENISVTRNVITRRYGNFYGKDLGTERTINLTTEDDWEYDDAEY